MSFAKAIRLLRRFWWLAGVVVILCLGPIVALILVTPDEYVSSGTFVVQPRSADQSDVVRAASTLSDAAEINSTFAQIAESDLIEGRARERLGLTGERIAGLDVNGSAVSRTNLITLSVRTRDPELSRDMAVAVSEETTAYVEEVSDVFALVALDRPRLPTTPERSDPLVLLGAGLLIAVVAAWGLTWLADTVFPEGERPSLSRLRPSETGRDEAGYLGLRLREEMSRADHRRGRFHVVILRVILPWRSHPGADTLAKPSGHQVASTALAMETELREYDHLGHLPDHEPATFVSVVPERSDEELEALVGILEGTVAKRITRTFGPGGTATTAWCAYEDRSFEGDPDAVEIAETLAAVGVR